MTEPTRIAADADADAAIVEKFLFALRDQDFDTIETLVADDVVYENYGYTRLRGGKRLVKLLRGMQRAPGAGFDVKLHRNVSEGGSVLNERTDVLKFGPVRMIFVVLGVFEVRDGRITLWRDYIDLFDFLKGIVRGIVGAAVPALQRKF